MDEYLATQGRGEMLPVDHVAPTYDEVEEYFGDGDTEFVRLSGETVGTAKLAIVELPGVEFIAGAWSWANPTRGCTSDRHVVFEAVPEPRDTFFNGVAARPENVHVYGPNTELLDSSPPQVGFMMVSIEADELESARQVLGQGEPAHAPGQFATYSCESAEHFQQTAKAFASMLDEDHHGARPVATAACFHDNLITDALNMIGRPECRREIERVRHLTALEIVMVCDDYAAAQRYRGVTSLGLSRAAGYSERRVRSAFKQLTGVPPMHFMQSRAMHEIRRELHSGAAASVTDAAYTWGFTELGRFAGLYRSQFGELPSETLLAARYRRPERELSTGQSGVSTLV